MVLILNWTFSNLIKLAWDIFTLSSSLFFLIFRSFSFPAGCELFFWIGRAVNPSLLEYVHYINAVLTSRTLHHITSHRTVKYISTFMTCMRQLHTKHKMQSTENTSWRYILPVQIHSTHRHLLLVSPYLLQYPLIRCVFGVSSIDGQDIAILTEGSEMARYVHTFVRIYVCMSVHVFQQVESVSWRVSHLVRQLLSHSINRRVSHITSSSHTSYFSPSLLCYFSDILLIVSFHFFFFSNFALFHHVFHFYFFFFTAVECRAWFKLWEPTGRDTCISTLLGNDNDITLLLLPFLSVISFTLTLTCFVFYNLFLCIFLFCFFFIPTYWNFQKLWEALSFCSTFAVHILLLRSFVCLFVSLQWLSWSDWWHFHSQKRFIKKMRVTRIYFCL